MLDSFRPHSITAPRISDHRDSRSSWQRIAGRSSAGGYALPFWRGRASPRCPFRVSIRREARSSCRRLRQRRLILSVMRIMPAESIRWRRFCRNSPSGSIPRSLPQRLGQRPSLGRNGLDTCWSFLALAQRLQFLRSTCENTQSSRPGFCRKLHRSAPVATRPGSSMSMPMLRPNCDPA